MVEKNSNRKIASSEKQHATRESSTMLNDQTIKLNFVRNRLETFQLNLLRDVQKRISGMIDEVLQELRQHELQINEFRNFAIPQSLHLNNKSSNWSTKTEIPRQTVETTCVKDVNELDEKITNSLASNVPVEGEPTKKRSKKYQTLPTKVFVMRESLLTALLEVDHMKTIYHIFYIIFFVFMLNNISYEYFVRGSVSFGLGTFRSGFENIHKVAGVWILQHVFVFSVFFAFRGWSYMRTKLYKHKTLQHLWSNSCLLIYIGTQLIFAYVPTKICIYLNLPFVTASVLLLETVRLLMKMHSFVRTVAPRVITGTTQTKQELPKQITKVPAFNKYLYYLFAPTLLYRDEYPRTSTIRWKFALSCLLEVVAVAFLYSYIYNRHIKHHFEKFGVEEINITTVTYTLFGMLMPGIIIFLSGFYMILHSWLNFTAELLRFGDRMFYRDWWTASNYEAYYRNWNIVVHDWLHEYIYRDFFAYVFKGSKLLSSMTVFFISALFHEYILGYALQVVFPVIFFFFGVIGVISIFVTRCIPKNLGNIYLWFSLIYGNSWIISLYSMEYFARINCPKEFNSWTEYVVPHVWNCFINEQSQNMQTR